MYSGSETRRRNWPWSTRMDTWENQDLERLSLIWTKYALLFVSYHKTASCVTAITKYHGDKQSYGKKEDPNCIDKSQNFDVLKRASQTTNEKKLEYITQIWWQNFSGTLTTTQWQPGYDSSLHQHQHHQCPQQQQQQQQKDSNNDDNSNNLTPSEDHIKQ